MKRSGFKLKAPWMQKPAQDENEENQPLAQEECAPAAIKKVALFTRRAVMAPVNDAVYSQPKDVKGKSGRYKPTAFESAWMHDIVAYGCVACRADGNESRPTAVHHILRGGRRLGHLFTIGLCDPGHHQGGQTIGLISRHPWKAEFEKRYGTEMELLEQLRAQIGGNHG